MENHQIKVTRTAHYTTIGNAGPEVKYLWIACHGYGQLARNFIRKFDVLQSEDTFIIAPEGLSRFYWGGVTGEVVASWMTKADRLQEIEDYTNFISQLYHRYFPLLAPNVKVILFGFSQGCATIMRWIMRAFPRFDQVILWAGMLPEDLNYRPHLSYLQDKDFHFIYGLQDEYLTSQRLEFIQHFSKEQGLKIKEHTFDGPHKIIRSILKEFVEEWVKV